MKPAHVGSAYTAESVAVQPLRFPAFTGLSRRDRKTAVLDHGTEGHGDLI
jgi:hypothetical protein